MVPLKYAIFTEVRNSEVLLADSSDVALNDLLFHHRDGLRLSAAGLAVMKKLFTSYVFEIPVTIKTKHQFGLSKMMYPYFFTKRRLVLFSTMDATVIKLCGGIEGFLENCGQIDNHE